MVYGAYLRQNNGTPLPPELLPLPTASAFGEPSALTPWTTANLCSNSSNEDACNMWPVPELCTAEPSGHRPGQPLRPVWVQSSYLSRCLRPLVCAAPRRWHLHEDSRRSVTLRLLPNTSASDPRGLVTRQPRLGRHTVLSRKLATPYNFNGLRVEHCAPLPKQLTDHRGADGHNGAPAQCR